MMSLEQSEVMKAGTGVSARRALKQLHGYLWVGGIAFVIDAGLLLLLVKAGLYYIAANTVSFMIANVFNFFAGHYWVFHGSRESGGIFQSYVGVLAISVAGLVINDAVMYVAVDHVALSVLFAKVLATIIVLFWNFGARKRWVYV
jgi:putative flippase GtrA